MRERKASVIGRGAVGWGGDARPLGLCALVTIVYGVANLGAGPVRWGVLVADR
jgi:hypothetical protein